MRNDSHRQELRDLYSRTEDTSGAQFFPARDKANLYSDGCIFKVCAYCRVSTDNEEQLSSFELQQQHYQQLAGQHANWDLVHIFAEI